MSRAQIELSVNTIVIIVVSMAIVTTGIVMLYKFQKGLTNTAYTLDKQTEDLLKSLMLKNNYNVAAYPQYVTIAPGGNAFIGLGIANSMDNKQTFQIVINGPSVTLYRIYSNPVTTKIFSGSDPWVTDMTSQKSNIRVNPTGWSHDLNAKDQVTNAILVNMPRNAERGEYEITISVKHANITGTCIPAPPCTVASTYGLAKIYVTTG